MAYYVFWQGQRIDNSTAFPETIYKNRPGSKKRAAEIKRLGMEIPFTAAWNVFLEKKLLSRPKSFEHKPGNSFSA